MALQIYNSNSIGSGIQANLGTADDVYIGANGFLGSTNFIAVDGTGSNHSVTVLGSVVAADFAISVGDDSALDFGEEIRIGAKAIAVSESAYAIVIEAHSSIVENNGTVTGVSGVSFDGDATGGTSELVNNGEIAATNAAVFRLGSEDFLFINNGVASGDADGAVYYGIDSTGDQTVFNNGRLNGAVLLGSGNDIYDGSKGRITGGAFAFDGNDTLTGGKYAETFGGGHGRDIQSGGGGADHFKFVDTADSTLAKSGRDLIKDFSHAQHDKIDLSFIDPEKSNDGPDEKFSFIGTQAFSGAEGELRYKFSGSSTFVEGDIDGDKHGDFSIELRGSVALHAGDFIL